MKAVNVLFSHSSYQEKMWDAYHQGIRDAVVSGVKDKALSESKNSREARPYNEGWKFGIKLCDEKEEIDRQVNR